MITGVTPMSEFQVRIVDLPPMRVAAVRAFSETPEQDAWSRLEAWARPLGLLDALDRHPVFGFNNPAPRAGDKRYGYEFWIVPGEGVLPGPAIEVKSFPGGRYAVTRCRLQGDPAGELPVVWKRLWDWVQHSPYRWRRAQELEGLRNPGAPADELVLDLHLPIEP